jgi:hypothetical protein
MEKEMFEELKKACLSVWKNYKDRPGDYYQEKVGYVKRITNPKDYYILIQMFDINNQRKLYEKLSPEARDYYMEYFTYMRERFGI